MRDNNNSTGGEISLDATPVTDVSSLISNNSVQYDCRRVNILNFGVTNARSISAKISSVVENFENLGLDFLTVSETWLKRGKKSNDIIRLLKDHGLGIIKKDRDIRGGGVGIVFDHNKVTLKEAFRFPADIEAVCAVGKSAATGKKIVIISAYIPPKTDAAGLLRFKVVLKEKMEQIKADLGDFGFFMGADTNRRDISDCFESFPTIVRIAHGPTRGNAALDVCFTNRADSVKEVKICSPLEDGEGTQSDHAICFFKSVEDKVHEYKTRKFTLRKYSDWGEEEFGRLLGSTDWSCLLGKEPDEAVCILNQKLTEYCDQCFPWIEHKTRSCDKPWITKRIRRLLRRKRRAFKERGKSEYYKRKRDDADREVKKNKVRFLDKVKGRFKTTKNPKEYYAAVKLLHTEEAPKRWDVCSLFPGEDELTVASKSADFFNKISREFRPVPNPVGVDFEDLAPSEAEVVKKLKKMKKPASKVKGDIDRRLIIKYPELLAKPLTIVYRSIYRVLRWPRAWKEETVTLLPKARVPDSLGQVRNISCTPFFSKVLESFLLDDLREDITLADQQFGGRKGQGVDHMLIETWEEILKSLEQKDTAVNLMAIDFEKAFNRMDHGICVETLKEMGAKVHTTSLVQAFLHGRVMSVKINDTFSPPLPVSGGAPQGSILGPFLFCASINKLLNVEIGDKAPPPPPHPHPATVQEGLPPTFDESSLSSGSDVNSSDDDGPLNFFRWFRPRVLEDSVLSERSPQEEIDTMDGHPDWEEGSTQINGYIDDLNVIERVRESGAITHMTEMKTRKFIHSPESEKIFGGINAVASEDNMRVNPKKTQLLCITTSTSYDSTSYIRHEDERLRSGEFLKILGFYFDKNPGVGFHVRKMLEKIRDKLWSLRHLKKCGLSQRDLVGVYKTFLLPILDYAIPTYHPQLNLFLASEIERVQADSMRIIFGPLVAYGTILEAGIVEEHRIRRERITRSFAVKSLGNARFRDKWFPRNDEVNYGLRNRERFEVRFARTERYTKSPLQYMRRVLNEIHA